MAEYAVWAPYAKTARLVLADVHRPIVMRRDGAWWRTEAPVNEGRYAFSIDGGPPMPDPRSCYQPDGVHMASQVVDHGSFNWTDANWRGIDLAQSVLYELHIGTFTAEGTFEAAIERLDHLCELGIDAIEIMPVVEFSGMRGWGYDGVDLYAPHHVYGGPAGLKKLVNACHERGLGVIIDVVYNHLGPDGNYLGAYGPYFTERHKTPWGDAVNFDGDEADGVRGFVLGNVYMWLDCYHVDGLRLDAVHAIIDESSKHIVTEIVEVAHDVGTKREFPAWVIAETDLNDPKIVQSVEAGGWAADAQWNDDFHHALHALVTGERDGYYVDFGDIENLATAIRDTYVFTGQDSKFLGRERGKSVGDVTADHFIVFSQNHDQVGNRAAGERLSMQVDRRLLDVVAAVVILSPFVPLLFQGEEWGARTPFLYFTNYSDPELSAAVTAGRKEEFKYSEANSSEIADPQSEGSFRKSKLDWAEMQSADNARLFEWYKTLIKLRRSHADFTSNDRDVKVDGQVLIMRRGEHRVIANFGQEAQTVDGDIQVEPYSVRILSS